MDFIMDFFKNDITNAIISLEKGVSMSAAVLPILTALLNQS